MSSYSIPKQDALELEVKVLGALIARNWQAHCRTLYFRRLSMAYKWLHKGKLLMLYPGIVSIEDEIKLMEENRASRRRRATDEWSLDVSKKQRSKEEGLAQRLEDSVETVPNIADVIERFEHAAKALFQESVRGFFLPLVTVALGCVARIRVLLQQLGMYALDTIPQLIDRGSSLSGILRIKWDREQFTSIRLVFLPTRPSSRVAKKSDRNVLSVLKELGIQQEGDANDPMVDKSLPSMHEGDIGESVYASAVKDNVDDKPSSTAAEVDAIDTNTEMLKIIKQKGGEKDTAKPKKKRRKAKGKSKEEHSHDKPAKRKKRAKGDFFDDLFAKR